MLSMDDNDHEVDSKEIVDGRRGDAGKGKAEVEFARRMKWLKEVCREWMG